MANDSTRMRASKASAGRGVEAMRPRGAASSRDEPTSRRRKVMIVDDCIELMNSVARVLSRAGYEVILCDSPFAFAAMLREKHPDIVLVDVGLPALDGTKLVEIAGRNGEFCPMILFSGRSESELVELAAQCDADGYLCKTADSEEILRTIARHLPPELVF